MQDPQEIQHQVLGPKQTHTPKANNGLVAKQFLGDSESEYISKQ